MAAIPKYDVAISFLSADQPVAAALHGALASSLDVFYYPHSQEELAGTNGLESMRGPFLDESRVVVVLYREAWGTTPWTRVEATAITDRCLRDGWQSLFFMMLDGSTPPKWLPHTHVRFNYADFGLEQAVGALKARVQDCGGRLQPLTAARRVEAFNRDQAYAADRRELRSAMGRQRVQRETAELFRIIERLCNDMEAAGTLTVQLAVDESACHLRNQKVSLVVALDYTSSPSPSETQSEYELSARMFSKRLGFRGEHLAYRNGEPRKVKEIVYLPDLDRARDFVWIEKQNPSRLLSSGQLANDIIVQFVDLFETAQNGAFANSGRPPATPYRRRR